METVRNGTDVTGDGIGDIIFFFMTSGHRSVELYRLSLGHEVKVEEHIKFSDPCKVALGLSGQRNFDNYDDFFGHYGAVVLCRRQGGQYLLALDLMSWWTQY